MLSEIVHVRGNQLVPQLLLKPADTLHTHSVDTLDLIEV